MTLSFSNQLISSIGYRKIFEGELISAYFHSLIIYELQGLIIHNDAISSFSGEICDIKYKVAVGININQLSQTLVANDISEDLAAWVAEKKTAPPYAMIHLEPTKLYECNDGFVKENGSGLETLDSFAEAKADLNTIEKKVLPSIVTALRCAFSSSDHHINLKFVSREVFGLTKSGVVVHDIRFQMNATMYVSRAMASSDLQDAIRQSKSLAQSINPKVSKFFYLALQEEDPVKRFLYFFISLEIQTHLTYSKINHFEKISHLVNVEDRVSIASKDFFNIQRERIVNIKDKFIWCALCSWTQITDKDINDFKNFKKIRDDITHGSIAETDETSVIAIEKLATKIQWQI